MSIRIGVDTGGTFTDVVLYDEETRELQITKTPSTPPNFDEGVLTGIRKILDETGTDPDRVEFLSHGTTVGTNAVLEGELPPLGLITNEGLGDVLEIGTQTRPELYNLQVDKPPALIPRKLRKGVPGRIGAEGDVVDELDEAAVAEAVEDLVEADVDAIVVSQLFSFVNDAHERAVGDVIEDVLPEMDYSLSSEVHPEIREYDRTITAVLNEAIKSKVRDYFARLDEGIADIGIEVPMNIMHSGGGIFSTELATQSAIRTVLSGPAAGAVGVQHASQQEGFDNAIGMDMGGTSADVAIIRDDKIVRTTEGEINDLPVKTPMIDIATVGAGGGSIAWIDEGSALRIGPESSGADPGPICYGRGGERPTVTDANLLLGRLNPDFFLGGEMDLAVEKTRRLFEEKIADPLDQSIEEAALAVIEVANAQLARNIRRVTVERGDDPSEYALVACGGAGPLQSADVASIMDIETVIIPRNPGVLSAQGLHVANVRADKSRSYNGAIDDHDVLDATYAELEAEIRDNVTEQGINPTNVEFERSADVRYVGQSYELTVPVEGADPSEALDSAVESFHEKHDRLYGHARWDEDVELVTVRVSGYVPTPEIDRTVEPGDADPHRGTRDVVFADHGTLSADIYDRQHLDASTEFDGPAILEESDSTTLVPPDATATVSDRGNVRIYLD